MVLHEDEDLFVLNKPQGLAVQGGTGTHRHVDGLLMGLAAEIGERPRLVHRLDRDTSGVLVIAKRRAVAAVAGPAFRNQERAQDLLGLVKGVPKPRQGKIDLPLIKAQTGEGDRVRAAGEEEDQAQRAVTRLRGDRQGPAGGVMAVAQAGHRPATPAARPYGDSSAIRSWATANMAAWKASPTASRRSFICMPGALRFHIRAEEP